ncbi:hypothetical protein K1719_002039 [Acacia pycnantha]|nr:hypothetical protein K1719_002039 [Acacia pycnantha]
MILADTKIGQKLLLLLSSKSPESGGEFDLRPSALSNDELLHYDSSSVIICAVGARYKSYCSNIGRTFLIDAEPFQSKAYEEEEEEEGTTLRSDNHEMSKEELRRQEDDDGSDSESLVKPGDEDEGKTWEELERTARNEAREKEDEFDSEEQRKRRKTKERRSKSSSSSMPKRSIIR